MTSEEMVFMEKILPDYYKHFKKYPRSLIARVYGIYTVTMEGYLPVNLILMGNTLRFQKITDVHRVYDIKGSTFNRFVKVDASTKPTTTLKDTNYLQNAHEFQEVNLSERAVKMLNQ
jgi:1-phosphatidylinositol-4-phosphate 5-kinase